MEYITNLENLKLNNSIITIGKFDGLHLGHRKLLSKMKKLRDECGGKIVIFTFFQAPGDVLNNCQSKKILTHAEKMMYFEKQGVDYVIECTKTSEILGMEAEEFVKNILVDKLSVAHFVAGRDFAFGKGRKGNVDMLKGMAKTYGFNLHVYEKVKFHSADISSTLIKEKILKGDIAQANEMLSTPFSFIGIVEHGKKIGRKMGLPTVNIEPEPDKILPPLGVYKVQVEVGEKTYNGIANIGCKPTVKKSDVINIETNIFDMNEDIYGQVIEVKFDRFIRPEKKFDSVEELKAQIQRDIRKVQEN